MNDEIEYVIKSVHNFELKSGFFSGMNSPSLAFYIVHSENDFAILKDLLSVIQEFSADWSDFEHLDPDLLKRALDESQFANPLAEFLLSSAIWLQSLCGVPVTSHGVSFMGKDRLFLFAPAQEAIASVVQELLVLLIGMANHALKTGNPADVVLEDLQPICRKLRDEIKKQPPNIAYLLCAARKRNVPALAKIAKFFVFGQGRRAVVLNSTLSAKESYFGTVTARDKTASAMLLRQLGLPVPEQVRVASLQDALNQAQRIGYPVVIKPADLDGGIGVFPGLQNAGELEQAWKLARSKSPNIVLEKHVEGIDYRLLVAKGELIAAVERKPAQVTGDGASTVSELINAENARRRAPGGGISLLKPLPNDPETQSVLASQGLTLEDIPPPEQVVKLRLASNHAQGGTVRWCLDDVHDANGKLALNIAESFSLDVAGIDFITTDISRPWWEVSSAICEVNAQPSLGHPTAHGLFEKMLAKFLPDKATIPQIAIVGEAGAVTCAMEELERSFIQRGFQVGSVKPGGTFLDNELIGRHGNVYQGHRIIIMHPRATVALIGVTNANDLRFGLASPKLDYVVLSTQELGGIAQHLTKSFGGRIVPLQSLLSP